MRLGLVGAGRIADRVSKTLSQMPEVELYAVAARDLERAKEFANIHGYEKAYGSYDELYSDSSVDLVYICTPHTLHYPNIVKALNAGRNVICEKPITVNAEEAISAFELAKEKGLYLAEAMWIRYMPSRQIIADTLASGLIGDLKMFSGSLSYNITFKERIISKDLAGGALLDLGVYGLNFAAMFMGYDIKDIDVSVVYTDTGVDESESITLKYADGRIAVLTHSVVSAGGREGIFHGEKGHIVVDNINCPAKMDVFDKDGQLINHIDFPIKHSGYEYEFEEADLMLREGKTTSHSMPPEESIKIMKLCDQIRAKFD